MYETEKVPNVLEYIEIDGSFGEGGGQILRTSMSLSAILGKPIRITKIRAGRKEPGLRPQHLQAVVASSELSYGSLEGAKIGSSEIRFVPGEPPRSFRRTINTGTAGSVTLIAQALIPIAIFRGISMELELIGGTEVPMSPTIDYLTKIVCPIYSIVGGNVSIELKKRGYYPRGGGRIEVRSVPSSGAKALDLIGRKEKGARSVEVLSVSRNLPSHVAERQAKEARHRLSEAGVPVEEVHLDFEGESLSPGSSMLISSLSDEFIGASALGERGKRAEQVGTEVAEKFLRETRESPAVDSHLADMLATVLSCVNGASSYTTPVVTTHLRTNLEISKKLTGRNFRIEQAGTAWRVIIGRSSEKSN